MSERRQRSATESLLSVAFGVEMATILFGAIAMAGLHKQQWLEVLVSAVLLVAMLALAQATLRRGLHPIVYASQALLALPVVTEPMWVWPGSSASSFSRTASSKVNNSTVERNNHD